MSRSRKKNPITKDSGSTPDVRRLTRARIKVSDCNGAGYNKMVNTWDFNDVTLHLRESDRHIRAIREKYEKERQRILDNRHPLCIRLGKVGALKELERGQRRAIYHFAKRYRRK